MKNGVIGKVEKPIANQDFKNNIREEKKMKFYDLTFEEQEDELDELYWDLVRARDNLEKDNPFYDELFDLTMRVLAEKNETSKKIKDDTNEYLNNEYWRNQL